VTRPGPLWWRPLFPLLPEDRYQSSRTEYGSLRLLFPPLDPRRRQQAVEVVVSPPFSFFFFSVIDGILFEKIVVPPRPFSPRAPGKSLFFVPEYKLLLSTLNDAEPLSFPSRSCDLLKAGALKLFESSTPSFLGYEDAVGAFKWRRPPVLKGEAGLLPSLSNGSTGPLFFSFFFFFLGPIRARLLREKDVALRCAFSLSPRLYHSGTRETRGVSRAASFFPFPFPFSFLDRRKRWGADVFTGRFVFLGAVAYRPRSIFFFFFFPSFLGCSIRLNELPLSFLLPCPSPPSRRSQIGRGPLPFFLHRGTTGGSPRRSLGSPSLREQRALYRAPPAPPFSFSRYQKGGPPDARRSFSLLSVFEPLIGAVNSGSFSYPGTRRYGR